MCSCVLLRARGGVVLGVGGSILYFNNKTGPCHGGMWCPGGVCGCVFQAAASGAALCTPSAPIAWLYLVYYAVESSWTAFLTMHPMHVAMRRAVLDLATPACCCCLVLRCCRVRGCQHSSAMRCCALHPHFQHVSRLWVTFHGLCQAVHGLAPASL
jgi:hypothetical protein